MTQMKTSSDEMKVAIIANGKPQSRRVASKLLMPFEMILILFDQEKSRCGHLNWW